MPAVVKSFRSFANASGTGYERAVNPDSAFRRSWTRVDSLYTKSEADVDSQSGTMSSLRAANPAVQEVASGSGSTGTHPNDHNNSPAENRRDSPQHQPGRHPSRDAGHLDRHASGNPPEPASLVTPVLNPSSMNADLLHAGNSVVDFGEAKEHAYGIIEVQSRFVGPRKPILVKPGRLLVHQGALIKTGRTWRSQYLFLLFSDALVYARELPLGKLLFKQSLPLLHMKVQDVPQDPASFRVVSTVKSFIVKPAGDPSDAPADGQGEDAPVQAAAEVGDSAGAAELPVKKEWMQLITTTVAAHHRATNAKALDGVVAGVKTVSDNTTCTYCCKALSQLLRATYCKVCGYIFCRQCASRRYYTSPGVKGSVCGTCYPKLRAATLRRAADLLQSPHHNPPDEYHAVACFVCQSRFSLLRPKHHCWSCCSVVCANCSPQKTILPRLDPNNPLRMCNPCYRAHFSRHGGPP
ncbi:Vacuolar protein sorting-associated protein 27 [Diplonema papillatum]|nr:Vacuolar protein sorting-associated protein 27 [Diplonema papillatum]